MIDDELMKKFDSIEDLPISEEMLGAYLEGNLDSVEASHVEFAMSEDSEFSDFVEGVSSNSSSILDNMHNVLFAPMFPHSLSEIELDRLDSDMLQGSLYEDNTVAACCPEDFFNNINAQFSDDSISTENLFEEKFSTDDSFMGSDQSLDMDSHESDDMFNEDSIDI